MRKICNFIFLMRQASFFAALVLFITLPSTALAIDKRWVPKLYGIEGYLDMFGTYRSDVTETNINSSESSNTFVRERLTLAGFGYVYHPRFFLYQFRVSSGFQHSKNETNSGSSPWHTSSSTAFSVSGILLPEHPYNLSLWYTRGDYFPYIGSSTVVNTGGARLVYNRQPYFASASYSSTTREFGESSSSSTIDTLNFDASYYRKYANDRIFSLLGTYRHTDSKATTTGFKYATDEASISNSIWRGMFVLGSGVTYSSTKGGGNSSTLWSWSESAGLQLPYNFNASLTYHMSKNTSQSDSGTQGDLSSTQSGGSFNLSHKLYKSLTTNFSQGYTKATTSTGDSTSFSTGLSMAYAKRIPWGSLNASAGISRTTTDRTGSPVTIDEAHPGTTVPGSFILAGEDVQRSSINIYVRNPDLPDERVLLSIEHYTLAPLGNKLEVTILSLPLGIAVHPAYDFTVTYRMSEADVNSSTRNLYYNVRLSLFNSVFVPYYSHFTTTQTLSSGLLKGGDSLDTTSDNFGMQLSLSPFTVIAEYTDVKSDVNSYKRWMASVVYQQALSRTTSLRGSARYEATSYPAGLSGSRLASDYNVANASLGIAKTFPRQGLQFSFSGSYGQYWGFGRSDAYTLSTGASWNIKRFSLTFGGSATSSNSESGVNTEFGTSTSKRFSQYYFMSISRRLY